jgi:hypothetical protein
MAALRKVIVTGSDSGYFPLLAEMIQSVQRFEQSRQFDLRYFDMGLKDEEIRWLAERGCIGCKPGWDLEVPEPQRNTRHHSQAIRPFLRNYFPGYDVYVWLDADLWIQDWQVLERYVEGALGYGLAISFEKERAYRFQGWLLGWTLKHFILGYGLWRGLWLASRPHLNVGCFAIAAAAPHWEPWIARFQKAICRAGRVEPHDQFALIDAVYSDRLPTCILPATCNWICDRGIPVWDADAKLFCVPYPPYTAISVIHLAGPAKATNYSVATRSGQAHDVMLRFSSMRPDADRSAAA